MFVLINPEDSLFSGRGYELAGKSLDKSHSYNVLDTEDLVVETVDYGTLYNAVHDNGMEFHNIRERDGRLYFLVGWDCMPKCELMRGRLKVSDTVLILDGKRYEFGVTGTRVITQFGESLKNTIYLNEKELYVWLDSRMSADSCIPYLYRLGKYLIVQLYVAFSMKTRSWEDIVLTIIIDFNGNVIDLIPDEGMKQPDFKSLDPTFTTKFRTIFKMRY